VTRAERLARRTNAAARRRRFLRAFSRAHTRLLRRGRGRRYFGAPIVLLETVGRRSGRTRATPVIGVPWQNGWLVMAANAGVDATPAWWLNLRAAERGTVDGATVVPEITEDPAAFEAFCAAYPPARHYARFTAREIPLVMLRPI
jgi:deazaflavin-dependent oxidoreductase (nitroreductase family)